MESLRDYIEVHIYFFIAVGDNYLGGKQGDFVTSGNFSSTSQSFWG